MRPLPILAALLALLAGCAGQEPETAVDPEAGLTTSAAAEAIRGADEFGEPIYLEIWASDSPTTRRLAESGYLDLAEGKLSLTERGIGLGVKQTFFQSDIPVFSFPVGRLELVEVLEILDTPLAASSKQVDFRYRRAPNELGRELLAAGSRLDELAAERVLNGRAFLTPLAGGWKVGVLEL